MNSIDKLKDLKPVYVCVDAPQLQSYTKNGWQLVRVIEDTTPVLVTDQLPIFVPNGTGGGYTNNASFSKYLQQSRTMFLLMQPQDQYIETLLGEKNELMKQVNEYSGSVKVLQNDLNHVAEKHRHSEMMVESAHKALNEGRERNIELQALNRRLEEDIAKIRTAIGEKQMKEILATK